MAARSGPTWARWRRSPGAATPRSSRGMPRGRYRVYMLGFVPGFAYMGGVDESFAMPRRRDAARSVGAGRIGRHRRRQTGVYPGDSPGGWQLIGRTPTACSTLTRPQPACWRRATCVRFVPMARPWTGPVAWSAALVVVHAGSADHGAGPGPLGVPGVGRAGGRAHGRLFASPGQRAGRQSPACRDARGHAARAGAVEFEADAHAGRRRRRRSTVTVRRPAVPHGAVVPRAAAGGSASGARRARACVRRRSLAASTCRPCSAAARRIW